MLPEGVVAPLVVLQETGRLVGLFRKDLVGLGLGAGGGVDLLQLRDGEGCLHGIFAGEIIVEIGQVGLALPQLGDDQAHLQAPVAQVDVADDRVAEVAVDALDALADDGRAQMADVQGLCHIGAAVVQHHGPLFRVARHAGTLTAAHFLHMGGQIVLPEAQIEEAGVHRLGRGEDRAVLQPGSHLAGNDDGGLVGGFGGWHGAVALEFAQVGPVGDGDLAAGSVITGLSKGL